MKIHQLHIANMKGCGIYRVWRRRSVGTYYIDNVTTGAVLGCISPMDGDGVIDPIDDCATTAGTAELNGCPAGPSTAATAPTLAEADVLSIFSDAYTSIPIAEIRTGWSVNAVTSNYEISTGENAIKGIIQANDGYAGILFGQAFDMTGHSTISHGCLVT